MKKVTRVRKPLTLHFLNQKYIQYSDNQYYTFFVCKSLSLLHLYQNIKYQIVKIYHKKTSRIGRFQILCF